MKDDQTLYEQHQQKIWNEGRKQMRFTATLKSKQETHSEYAGDHAGLNGSGVAAYFQGFETSLELKSSGKAALSSNLQTGKQYIVTIEEIK